VALFAGSLESTAIVEGSPNGPVRYRGVPPFTEDDARIFAAARELLVAANFLLDHHRKVCPGESCTLMGIDQLQWAVDKAEGR
jgi:hypothetical protein